MSNTLILVADNDEDYLTTVCEFLESEGFQVISARNPIEARQRLKNGNVDLAILDLRLWNNTDEKDFSGLEVAKHASPFVPKLILTAFPTFEAVREALAPQLDGLPPALGFVAKHEGTGFLLTVIRRSLEIGVQLWYGDSESSAHRKPRRTRSSSRQRPPRKQPSKESLDPSPQPIELTGAQRQQLHKALLRAFPARGMLEQFISFTFNVNLSAVAGQGSQSDVVFELIEWAEATEQLDELVSAARKERPRSHLLKRFVQQFPGSFGIPSNPPPAQP